MIDRVKRLFKSSEQKLAPEDNSEQIIDSELLSELNHLQKKAAASTEKRLLVLAGAGSGKTKTLIQKVLHLIFEKNVDPSEILAITFTKNAANEMIDRLIFSADKKGHYRTIITNKRTTKTEKENARRKYVREYPWLSNITVKTFHSLCYSMLRQYGGKEFDSKFRILPDRSYDDDFSTKNQAPETQSDVIHKVLIETAADTDYLLELKRYILDFYVDRIRLQLHKRNVSGYEKPYTTLKGDNVRSKSERSIADWLYIHKIDYFYEPEVQFKDFPFQPDFYIPSADIYIEHVSNRSIGMKDKEEQFEIAGKVMFKTYETMTTDIRSFHNALERIIFPRLDENIEKMNALRFEDEFRAYGDKINEFLTQINRAIDKIKIEDIDHREIYKRADADPHDRVKIFYKLAEPLITGYMEYCTKRSYLDFNDLITKSVKLLENQEDARNFYRNKFKYVLVDEFQDVNTAQVKLLKNIIKSKTQLFCVGDDWQSIYGWRGSEVSYIVDFKNHFTNAEIIKLGINYRSNDTIVCASNELIKKNKHQLEKEIQSFNKEGKKIFLYCAQKESDDGVKNVIDKINQLLKNGYTKEDLLILYRTRKAFEPYWPAIKELHIPNKTIHSSKGLEAPVVFIIGLTAGMYGFPQVWEEDRIFQIIKKSNLELLMEEERRLFYVALTRAKEELFLISEVGNESQFLKEIPGQFIDRKNFLILDIKKPIKITCKKCGKNIDEEHKFCGYCGEKIIQETPEKIQQETPKKESMFNSNGSIKLPPNIEQRKKEEKTSIVITKVQVNTNNPAIAHLMIEFPDEIKKPKELIEFYNDVGNKRFPSVDHSIKIIDEKTICIAVNNGTKYMYSLLNYLTDEFEKHLSAQGKVLVKGSWDKYE